MIALVQCTVNEDVLYQNQPDPCEWDCCELCWYGVVNSGTGYMWDGVNLVVWNRKEDEFTEPSGNVWKPDYPVGIQFEKDERSKTWQVMPR